MVEKTTFFEELKEKLESNSNSNFHINCLDWVARVWIQNMCDLIDEKLKELKKEKE